MKAQATLMSRYSLRTKVVLTMVVALFGIMTIVFSWLYYSVSGQIAESFTARGLVLSRTIASASTVHVFYEQKQEQLKQIQDLVSQKDNRDIEYIVVLNRTAQDEPGVGGHGFKVLTHWARRPVDPNELLRNHRLVPDSRPQELGSILAFTQPVSAGLTTMFDFAGGLPDPAAADKPADPSDEDDLVMPGELDDEPDEQVDAQPGPEPSAATPGPKARAGAKENVLGYICLGLSTEKLDAQRNSAFLIMIFGLLGGVGLFALVITVFSNRFSQRLVAIMDAARRISQGNLTETIQDDVQDEIGMLAGALNQISSNLNDIMSAVSTVSASLADVVEQITASTEEVAQGAEHQVASVDQTSASMSEMLLSLKGIAENVEILASSAEESSSSILEMAATNDEMADNIHSLAASVEQTTGSIGQMTQTIKEVARNVEDLSAAADQTSTSMREIDVTISQVEGNANQTAELSEEVRRDAERGAESVQLTQQGIGRINQYTQDAFDVMGSLGKKIQAIGQVLTVIDDVAEQTNLLALNAAIIAAQAGEHGKGFAVVADEIKDLAERTAASTSEIASLIQAVQSETRNVIGAMDRGLDSVKDGVRLSTEAEGALRQIVESATKSTSMVREIARATVEQARGSKEVTNAILRIAETVQQIAAATAQQAKGSEQIMSSAERMRIITQHVHGSSQEQARGSKQITRAIENISEMVNHLNRAQREQARGAEQVTKAVERIKEIAERNSQSMGSMKTSVDLVARQADTLRDQLARLKL